MNDNLGCGTGVAGRGIAGREAFSGKVLGIDLSPHLVEVARQLSDQEGKGDQLEFQAGDTRKLQQSDSYFDAVVAHTLVSHVDDPVVVLKEAARLLKPGGLVGIFDGDYASLTFDHEEPAKGREYDEAIQQAVITNPRAMRQMPRLLRKAGLELVTSFSYCSCRDGAGGLLEPGFRVVPQTGSKIRNNDN